MVTVVTQQALWKTLYVSITLKNEFDNLVFYFWIVINISIFIFMWLDAIFFLESTGAKSVCDVGVVVILKKSFLPCADAKGKTHHMLGAGTMEPLYRE